LEFPPEVSSEGLIGLRVPNREDTLQLIRGCSSSLVGTSANISGMPPATTADEVLTSLGEEIDIVLDGGPCKSGKESTVVRVTSKGCLILREGAISIESISKWCQIVESE